MLAFQLKQRLQQQLQQQQRSQTLTQKLRAYSAKYVKINTVDVARAKCLMTEVVEKEILRYCFERSALPILKLEYHGSMYERLKTEAADEMDVMVVIKATDAEVAILETGVPGFDVLRAASGQNSLVPYPLRGFCNSQGYVLPSAIRYTWFRRLVSAATCDYQRRFPLTPLKLTVQDHGPAVQLDIGMKLNPFLTLLSVDLVPCFNIHDRYYVPKQYKRLQPVLNNHLLWKRSFALQEKERIQYMDRDDHGCRHELLRIVKTIIKRDHILRLMTSYHAKHAFLHYINTPRNWSGENALGDHFLGFIRALQGMFVRGSIQHFWEPQFNLMEDISRHAPLLGYRCSIILNSEEERNRLLST